LVVPFARLRTIIFLPTRLVCAGQRLFSVEESASA
jgi:hypothetical protein